jgi:hypothetical protein
MLQICERCPFAALEIAAETRMILLRINYLDELDALHKNNRKVREYRSSKIDCRCRMPGSRGGDSYRRSRRVSPGVRIGDSLKLLHLCKETISAV